MKYADERFARIARDRRRPLRERIAANNQVIGLGIMSAMARGNHLMSSCRVNLGDEYPSWRNTLTEYSRS